MIIRPIYTPDIVNAKLLLLMVKKKIINGDWQKRI